MVEIHTNCSERISDEKKVAWMSMIFTSNDEACVLGLGKTGSLGPWSRVIVHCSKLSFCQNDSPIGGSFWQKDSLLQYTMTLLQGPKDPILPTLV